MPPVLSLEFINTTEHYRPNDVIAEKLRQRVIVPIIGPTAVGKSSLMDAACQVDQGFHRVTGFTTRPQRPAEPDSTYRFLDHSPQIVQDIEAKALHGDLVQVTIHPTTGYIYGSEVTDYAARYNVIDMLTTEMPNIRALPFGEERAIAVATEPAAWEKWFMQRFVANPEIDDAVKRLKEAESCIHWALSDTEVLWLHNKPELLDESAEQLIKLARGQAKSDNYARSLAQTMLTNTIPSLKQQIRG